MFPIEIYRSTLEMERHIWERDFEQSERQREKGYKKETNGKVKGISQVYVGIAADDRVIIRSVSAANRRRILIGSKTLKWKSRLVEHRVENRKRSRLGTRRDNVKTVEY